MEKISTGSNTDSDLRVVTIDARGEVKQPQKLKGKHSDDQVPRFKRPIPSSKNQNQHANQSKGNGKAPQFLLFEDFKG